MPRSRSSAPRAAEALGAAQREHAAAQAQLETLRQIQAAAEDNAPLQRMARAPRPGAGARLWQKLRIDHGWETAVESVLRERLHALELTDASRLSAALADRPPVKASVFDHGSRRRRAAPAAGLPLASKIHVVRSGGRRRARRLAGRRAWPSKARPTRACARRWPPGARDGEPRRATSSRATRVSFHAPDPDDAGLLARQAEIEELEKRCGELAPDAGGGRGRAAAARGRRCVRSEALEQARLDIAQRQKALHDAQIEELKLAQAQERYRERSAQVRAELDEVARRGRPRPRGAGASQAAAARIGEDDRAAAQRAPRRRARRCSRPRARSPGSASAAQQAEREAQDALFGERECASKIAEIDNSVKVIDQQIERADTEVARLNEELAADPIPAVRAALETAVEARIACEKTLAEARNAVEAAAGALRELEEAQAAGRSARRAAARAHRRAAPEGAGGADQPRAVRRAARGGGRGRGAARDARPKARRAPSSLQGEITRLTEAISELGAVNLAALEELSTSQERKAYLDAQSADLDEAVTTLEDAIRKIDRETRELLRETFETVNGHFGELFPTLFGGGEAKLSMTGEEILDAGVQVMAQPPGKRNTSIHLLSGGEKALTAIALVFSLFQLNPAPFCLLDEVDAPLDDSNTVRFCDLVRKMSAQTQFLFISHNKITMEMAEQLVGVTMPEPGVSRVVAVDIEEALRIREELRSLGCIYERPGARSARPRRRCCSPACWSTTASRSARRSARSPPVTRTRCSRRRRRCAARADAAQASSRRASPCRDRRVDYVIDVRCRAPGSRRRLERDRASFRAARACSCRARTTHLARRRCSW